MCNTLKEFFLFVCYVVMSFFLSSSCFPSSSSTHRYRGDCFTVSLRPHKSHCYFKYMFSKVQVVGVYDVLDTVAVGRLNTCVDSAADLTSFYCQPTFKTQCFCRPSCLFSSVLMCLTLHLCFCL